MRMTWREAAEEAARCGFSYAATIPARAIDEYAPDAQDFRAPEIDPLALLPEGRSLLVLGMPFAMYAPWPAGTAEVSAYYVASHGAHQQHRLLAERLVARGCQAVSGSRLPAKLIARSAGLGVIGRNCLLRNDAWGSSLLIQVLVTDIEPQPDIRPMAATGCGECDRCARACPTGALRGNGRLDTGRCIRAHMLGGKAIPEALREPMGTRLLGCEVCQRACPRNAHIARATPNSAPFAIRALLTADAGSLREIARLIGANEARAQRLMAQAAIAAGNSRDAQYLPMLEALTDHERPAIAEHARWAIEKIMEG